MTSKLLGSPELLPQTTWSLLQQAIDLNGPFRLPVLATGREGSVDARTLVLRDASLAERMLECHSDIRSAKVEQLRQYSRMTWVFYNPETKLQLRMSGEGRVLNDVSTVDAIWAALSPHTQRAYTQHLDPGTPVTSLDGAAPCPGVDDPKSGRRHFAVIRCHVTDIHWLALNREGHQCARAVFTDDQWSSTWVMP